MTRLVASRAPKVAIRARFADRARSEIQVARART